MLTIARRLRCDDRGTTTVEYGLILALVVLAILGALSAVAGDTNRLWSTANERTRDAAAAKGNQF